VAAVMENVWGKKSYMFSKAVTLKAVIRVLGKITEDENFMDDWEENHQQAFLEKIKNWGALSREFRSDGFYERFAAKGQIERTRKIHDFLVKNLA
jgi:hypothetical protein